MRKCFTLIEITITVVVLLILVTFGGVTYQQLLENARQRACAVNLNALEAAVEVYALEGDSLPATLGDLKIEHLKKGYAKAIKRRDWLTKLSYLFIKINISGEAYAQFLTPDNLERYGVSSQILHCPSDTNGGASYGINANLAGKRWGEIPENAVIVGDCDSYTFSDDSELAHRHKKKRGLWHYEYIAQFVEKGKKIGHHKGPKSAEGPGPMGGHEVGGRGGRGDGRGGGCRDGRGGGDYN